MVLVIIFYSDNVSLTILRKKKIFCFKRAKLRQKEKILNIMMEEMSYVGKFYIYSIKHVICSITKATTTEKKILISFVNTIKLISGSKIILLSKYEIIVNFYHNSIQKRKIYYQLLRSYKFYYNILRNYRAFSYFIIKNFYYSKLNLR